MIEELRVKGFRLLRDFEWSPDDGVNILVGANSAGKSTVLDAIELVTRGSLGGVRAGNALTPDWFSASMVAEFFAQISMDQTPVIPSIEITAVFQDANEVASLCGCNGPEGPGEDAPGLYMRFDVPQELMTEFLSEAQSIATTAVKKALPVEYYECTWKSFKGDKLIRRPACITSTRIDSRPEPYSRAIDSYARELVESELTDASIREVSRKIREAHTRIDDDILAKIKIRRAESQKGFGVQLDKSPRSDWRNAIVLEHDGLPFSSLGSAEQVLSKCAITLERSANESIVLMEEPECHLSHTSLMELLSLVGNSIADGQQAFVTTHSSYVLNRLGLDKVSMMANGSSPRRFPDLSPKTCRYFKKLSGYDTLRIILAKKVVLVEGPTDEMVFAWAFRKLRGCLPEDRGIDVIEYGIRYARAFELAAAVGKNPLIALRDNDHKTEEHWRDAVGEFESKGYRLFVGHDAEGHTIEPQMVQANRDNLHLLAKTIGCESTDESGLEEYMTGHKTEWSLSLLEADSHATASLNVPRYISEAIDSIDPISAPVER